MMLVGAALAGCREPWARSRAILPFSTAWVLQGQDVPLYWRLNADFVLQRLVTAASERRYHGLRQKDRFTGTMPLSLGSQTEEVCDQ
jgi:hypothetical protein